MEPVARIRGYVHAYRSPEVKSVCARLASARSADDLPPQLRRRRRPSPTSGLGALALNLFEPRRLRYAAAPPPPRKKKPDGDDDGHEDDDDDPAAGATTPDEVRARLADVSGENAAEAFRAYCAKGDKGASMGPEAARDWLRSAAEKALARADRGVATTHRGAHFLVGVCGKDATGAVAAPRVPSELLNDDAPAAGRHVLRHLDGPRLLKLAGDPFRLAAALDPQIFGDDASFVSAQSGGSVDAASPAVAAAAPRAPPTTRSALPAARGGADPRRALPPRRGLPAAPRRGGPARGPRPRDAAPPGPRRDDDGRRRDPGAEPGAHRDRDLVCIELGLALVRHDLAEVAAPFFDEATAAILDDSFDVRHGARATRGDRNDAHTAELKGVKMDRRAAVFLAAAAGAAASQVAHEWAIEALRRRGAEHHPMDAALLARMGMDAMKSDEMLKGFQIMDQTRRAPGDANHVKAALAEDERKALIDQYEDRDAPEQHTRGVLALPRGAASAVARHKAMRKYGRRDRELPGGGRRGDDDDSFSGSEAFTSSGGEEGDDANDLGGEHRSQARRNGPELYRALDETVAGTLGFDLMCLDYILPTPNLDLAASIDVPEPVPEKKARDGFESGSDIEDVPEDKPLYLLPENQHHPPGS
ncbi:C2 domain-containing protein [Aureococcus anophagefferens]|nr:C2 domain-containing protein [Aureococcus anophagefferens]